MTSHDLTIYNDILDITFYSKNLNKIISNDLKLIFGNSSDEYKNSENSFANTEGRDNQNLSFNFTIPLFLKSLGVKSIRLENRLLLVNYNGNNLEISIEQDNFLKGISYLNFEFNGYSIDYDTLECIESFISDNWNSILQLIDSYKVTNLLDGGISKLFDTKIMVKEHES